MSDIRLETVKKLDLHPGDVLLVTVGGDIGEETWIPTFEDLIEVRDVWENAVPDDVEVIVAHHLIEPTIIRSKIMVGHWPPKVKQ